MFNNIKMLTGVGAKLLKEVGSMTSLCLRNIQSRLYLQRRWSSLEQFSVIRMPIPLEKKLQRIKLQKMRRDIKQRSQKGDQSVPIVACKRQVYNHYRGQSYDKFAEVPLASKGWKHKKSAGDYFTINGHVGNPSTQNLEDENFESFGLKKELLSAVYDMNFKNPTNIQTLAIPHVLKGKNTFITAETGNGKTLAFVVPLLQQISSWVTSLGSQLPLNSPLGLVITPGRELAEQIHGVASKLGASLGVKVELLIGGRTKKIMLYPKFSQPHLLIASFGALSKLTTVGVYQMSMVRHIVLDEADSLLDDSFNEKVLYFMSKFPVQVSRKDDHQPEIMSGVQVTMVAATLPRSLHTILHPFIDLESVMHISTPHLNRFMPHVPQRFFRVNKRTKSQKLMDLVKKDVQQRNSVIIFSNQSKTCDWISFLLNENDIPCVNFNGAMSSELRQGRFEEFQSGKVLFLSCTDLASRGLDTVQVSHVINYDFPKFIADYIHRCGRTGRVGSRGPSLVTNLINYWDEVDLVQSIEYAVRKEKTFHNVNANIKRILNSKTEKEIMLDQEVRPVET